ncbi:MAG: hypothetical protein JEY94_00610 [Melioribacteraceae bacterium]|nr:hypothetical protein [Melioribacteraceae bacterium]
MGNKSYNPEMHTTEHILNQTMGRLFNIDRSFSMHLERKKSKCDYHAERDLTEDEKSELEIKVNETIKDNLEVKEEFISKENAFAKFNLTRLPDESGDEIRIIKVGDYDACPCIGEHVSNTSEIGEFRLVSSSFNEGVLRIRFKLNRNI